MPGMAGIHAKNISVNKFAKRLLAMGSPPHFKNIGAGRNVYGGRSRLGSTRGLTLTVTEEVEGRRRVEDEEKRIVESHRQSGKTPKLTRSVLDSLRIARHWRRRPR